MATHDMHSFWDMHVSTPVARLVALTAHAQAAWLPLERSGSHQTSGGRLAAWMQVPQQAWATGWDG